MILNWSSISEHLRGTPNFKSVSLLGVSICSAGKTPFTCLSNSVIMSCSVLAVPPFSLLSSYNWLQPVLSINSD